MRALISNLGKTMKDEHSMNFSIESLVLSGGHVARRSSRHKSKTIERSFQRERNVFPAKLKNSNPKKSKTIEIQTLKLSRNGILNCTENSF